MMKNRSSPIGEIPDKANRRIAPLVFFDPSGSMHALDAVTKAYLWSAHTNTPACIVPQDPNQDIDSYFGFNWDKSPNLVEGIRDEKYLHYFNVKNQQEGERPLAIGVDNHRCLRKKVHELYGPHEYEVTGDTSRFWINPVTGTVYVNTGDTGQFWINPESGEVYKGLPEEDLVLVLRNNYRLFNESKKVDLRFSILEEAEKDRVRIRFVHFREFEALLSVLESFKVQLDKIPFRRLVVYSDTRVTRGDKIMYRGYLSDPWDVEFKLKFVMVEEAKDNDIARISSLRNRLGWHLNTVNFICVDEFQGKKYYIFEDFDPDWTMQDARDEDLDTILTSILFGALHIYRKERIHGKLEPLNVVRSRDGNVKLFGATGYMWGRTKESQELSSLGRLLRSCICMHLPNLEVYKEKNPLAHDVISRLLNNSITLPGLMRHHYTRDSEERLLSQDLPGLASNVRSK